MKGKSTVRFIVLSSLIAALYVVLTYLSLLLGLAYGGIQFRISEALNILAAFTPAAIPGLTIGCFISNIPSPLPTDMIFGTLATFLSAISIRFIARSKIKLIPFACIFPPAVFNAVLVGLQITFFTPEPATWLGFCISAVSVFIGEAAVGLLLGVPLYRLCKDKLQNFF